MADRFDQPWPGVGTGGSPAVDFANTLDWRLRERPTECLVAYADLARWARSAGLLAPTEARRLRAWAAREPGAAARALRRAISLREAIAEVLTALAHGRRPPGHALATLARVCRAAHGARTLRPRAGGALVDWAGPADPLRPAHAVALDAERLLTSAGAGRVRQCGDAQCGWFFLDRSRNGSRRWCSMTACGNRNKARRFWRQAARARA